MAPVAMSRVANPVVVTVALKKVAVAVAPVVVVEAGAVAVTVRKARVSASTPKAGRLQPTRMGALHRHSPKARVTRMRPESTRGRAKSAHPAMQNVADGVAVAAASAPTIWNRAT